VAVISHIEPVASSGNLDGAPKRGHPIIASAGGRSFLFDYSKDLWCLHAKSRSVRSPWAFTACDGQGHRKETYIS